jgi:hypothetical protein
MMGMDAINSRASEFVGINTDNDAQIQIDGQGISDISPALDFAGLPDPDGNNVDVSQETLISIAGLNNDNDNEALISQQDADMLGQLSVADSILNQVSSAFIDNMNQNDPQPDRFETDDGYEYIKDYNTETPESVDYILSYNQQTIGNVSLQYNDNDISAVQFEGEIDGVSYSSRRTNDLNGNEQLMVTGMEDNPNMTVVTTRDSKGNIIDADVYDPSSLEINEASLNYRTNNVPTELLNQNIQGEIYINEGSGSQQYYFDSNGQDSGRLYDINGQEVASYSHEGANMLIDFDTDPSKQLTLSYKQDRPFEMSVEDTSNSELQTNVDIETQDPTPPVPEPPSTPPPTTEPTATPPPTTEPPPTASVVDIGSIDIEEQVNEFLEADKDRKLEIFKDMIFSSFFKDFLKGLFEESEYGDIADVISELSPEQKTATFEAIAGLIDTQNPDPAVQEHIFNLLGEMDSPDNGGLMKTLMQEHSGNVDAVIGEGNLEELLGRVGDISEQAEFVNGLLEPTPIPENAFESIDGITEEQSGEIRESLNDAGILDENGNISEDIDLSSLDLSEISGLEDFASKYEDIIGVLESNQTANENSLAGFENIVDQLIEAGNDELLSEMINQHPELIDIIEDSENVDYLNALIGDSPIVASE